MSTESPTTGTDPTALYRDLNEAQADGLACVVCNEDYMTFLGDTAPVGFSATTGSQVFACATGCAATLCIVCGPGCCSPVLGVHTSCPGPLVGRTVVSVR